MGNTDRAEGGIQTSETESESNDEAHDEAHSPGDDGGPGEHEADGLPR